MSTNFCQLSHDTIQRSNRSHCIFNIHVHIKTADLDQGVSQVGERGRER